MLAKGWRRSAQANQAGARPPRVKVTPMMRTTFRALQFMRAPRHTLAIPKLRGGGHAGPSHTEQHEQHDHTFHRPTGCSKSRLRVMRSPSTAKASRSKPMRRMKFF